MGPVLRGWAFLARDTEEKVVPAMVVSLKGVID
jgi:hypothetical protein